MKHSVVPLWIHTWTHEEWQIVFPLWFCKCH